MHRTSQVWWTVASILFASGCGCSRTLNWSARMFVLRLADIDRVRDDVQILGLTSAGYGVFLAVKAPSTFSYLVISLGGLMVLGTNNNSSIVATVFVSVSDRSHGVLCILVSLFGISSVGGRSPSLLTTYSVVLCLLCLTHAAGVIFVYTKKDEALDWISSNSGDSQDVDDVRSFVERKCSPLHRAHFCHHLLILKIGGNIPIIRRNTIC